MTGRPTLLLALLIVLVAWPATAQSPFQIGAAPVLPPAQEGLLGLLQHWQEATYTALREVTIALSRGDGGALLSLLGLAFAYGVIHAAGPGHGKVVISTYLLAEGQSWRQGISLSILAAIAQGIMALALVSILLAVLQQRGVAIEAWVVRLEVIAFIAMAILGFYLILRAWRRFRRESAMVDPQELELAVPHQSHAHHHDHRHHDHDHHCGHSHMPTTPVTSWQEAAGIVFSIGLRPCTGAVLLLVFCLSQGLFWAGALGVGAMSLGTAITASVLAVLAVGGHHAILHWVDGSKARIAHLLMGGLGGAILFGLGVLLILATL